jgi:histidinol-phosphate aminotransferase
MTMALPVKQQDVLLNKGFSRRQVGRIASLLTAGAALPFYNEFAMAQDAERRMVRGAGGAGRMNDPDMVRISSNENPMGPCKEALESLARIAPKAWRYSPVGDDQDFVKTVSEIEDVPADHIAAFAGSSDPLHRCQCAFTSPAHSWTMGDPGYGAGAPAFIGSALHQVPLRPDFSHDVEAMIKADPDAGAYYVCNPNNPSGTLTARKDIEYLLEHKSKDAVVVIDEAYIHFSHNAQMSSDLVAKGKDVVVLRTFSKIYGMAGFRAGFAMGRPDLLGKLRQYGAGMSPVLGLTAATASMKVKGLIAERRAQMKQVREDTFAFLEKKNIKYVPSEANFFMMEVNRPGADFAKAMADNKVMIGRIWKAWPTKVRVTVGTQAEMLKFQAAVSKIMA